MAKKYKIMLTIISLLLILCVGALLYKKLVYDKKDKPVVYTEVLDKMDDYGYKLDDKDTKLYKDTYYELKKNLDSDEIDYEKYGEELSKLFVIDLLTISNKQNKYDVGGLDFLYESEREMFKNKVMDTIYEIVEDDSYNTRKQQLPTIKSITLDKKEETKYEIDDKKQDGYIYTYELEYEKDLGYTKKCSVTVVKDDNKMYVVEYTENK